MNRISNKSKTSQIISVILCRNGGTTAPHPLRKKYAYVAQAKEKRLEIRLPL